MSIPKVSPLNSDGHWTPTSGSRQAVEARSVLLQQGTHIASRVARETLGEHGIVPVTFDLDGDGWLPATNAVSRVLVLAHGHYDTSVKRWLDAVAGNGGAVLELSDASDVRPRIASWLEGREAVAA